MKNLVQIIIVLVLITGACSKKAYKVVENSVPETEKMLPPVAVQPESITEKYWKLIELNGKPVVGGESQKHEAFFILRNEGSRVTGHGGCNTFTGTFEINPEVKHIRFLQMTTTMMMCLNMEIEDAMKKVFETADNYSVSADGKYLSLNRARMAPLARFEVVYME